MDRRRRAKELAGLTESGFPSQQQIDRSRDNNQLFVKADKAYKALLQFLKKWDRDVGDDDPSPKQRKAIEVAVKKAKKDIQPFMQSDSNAIITHGTAAQKLYKNVKGTLDGINYMLYGD